MISAYLSTVGLFAWYSGQFVRCICSQVVGAFGKLVILIPLHSVRYIVVRTC